MQTSREPKLTEAEYAALSDFRYALRLFLRFSEEAAQGAGLTPQQHQALLAIKGFRDGAAPTIGQLAERLQLRHHSAVGLVDRLVSARWVQRTHDSPDRRQVGLVLTRRGEAVLGHLSAVHREQLRRVGPELAKLLKRLQG